MKSRIAILTLLISTFAGLESFAFQLADSVLSESNQLLPEALNNPPSISNVISGPKIFWTVIFLLAGYLVLKVATRFLNVWAERSIKYRITIKGFIPVLRILGWMIVIYIVIAGIIQPPMATVLAFSASVGVAVGFASQDILKNVFAGITILIEKPFNVGDKIEIGNYYGEVVEIGLRSTRLVTPDDSLVTVPNGELMNQSVSNANSGEPNCQVVAEFYLPEDIDTNQVRKIALKVAQTSKYVYLKKPIAVLFTHEVREKRTYMKMRLKAYVFDIREEFAFKSDMTESVIRELISQKIINSEVVKQ